MSEAHIPARQGGSGGRGSDRARFVIHVGCERQEKRREDCSHGTGEKRRDDYSHGGGEGIHPEEGIDER